VAAIKQAILKWKVVYFRDQFIDHAQQVAFGKQFGEVTPGHPYEGDVAPKGFPQIHTVSPKAYDERYGKGYTRKNGANGPGWHADVTPLINPPAYSILRAEVVPPYSGDTQFTNVAAAYQGLSEPLKKLIDGLRAEHRFGSNYNAERSEERIGDWVRNKPLASIHPVVRVHPETGERVIYVNPSFTKHIVGVSLRESRHLLDLLFEQVQQPEYTDRFRWQPGSIAFWDNRAALHLAPRDFEHLNFERVLHRITLVGDVPVGVDGARSESLSGDPFLAA
jgi:alpha-ketoglutarate-dependent taurine dioxygenase